MRTSLSQSSTTLSQTHKTKGLCAAQPFFSVKRMLNVRLQACAALVRPGAQVCDVGTDHAQLPVYLLEQGIAERVIASDISEGPLRSAERTIAEHGLTGQIQTIRSDGLAQISPEGLTDVVIAGMGGETIIHILEECPWRTEGIAFILQPMTKAEKLREWLYCNGYAIRQERCVQDGKFLYAVMLAVCTGEAAQPDVVQRYFGNIDLRLPVCRAYAKRQYDRLCKARDGLLRVGDDSLVRDAELLKKRLEESDEGSGSL